jgi:glycosyltransferase 2 family protein
LSRVKPLQPDDLQMAMVPGSSRTSRSSLARLTQLALVAAVIVLMLRLDIVSWAAAQRLLASPSAAVLSLLALFAAFNVNVLRWSMLVGVQGIRVRLSRLWSITFISFFFGMFLPGSVGSDALKLYYIARERKDARTSAVLSVFGDRVIGLLGLLILGLAFCLFELQFVLRHRLIAGLAGLLLAVTLALLCVLALAMWQRRALATYCALIPWLGRSALFAGIIRQTVNVLEHYRNAWGTLALALLLSLVAQLLVVAGIVVLAASQDFGNSTPFDFGFPAVMSALANQIPITPGGLAFGEGTFEYICRLQDPENLVRGYGTVLFASRFITIIATLPGLVAFLMRHPAPAAPTPRLADG